jgi:hypothetical protein
VKVVKEGDVDLTMVDTFANRLYSQVLKIACSAARIPVGGPDPLDAAWEKAEAENHWYA